MFDLLTQSICFMLGHMFNRCQVCLGAPTRRVDALSEHDGTTREGVILCEKCFQRRVAGLKGGTYLSDNKSFIVYNYYSYAKLPKAYKKKPALKAKRG